MHECVVNELAPGRRTNVDGNIEKKQELFVGDIIQKALNYNLCVECVSFSAGSYMDIGTPQDLMKALQYMENN
jgi:glucose-1-phosphate thymidylyltransferase